MKQKGKSYVQLEHLAGGAFAEKLTEALLQVADNIQNPNTDAVAKRKITIELKFAPNKTRSLVNTTIAVTTKLAATEAIDTQMVMGLNLRTGELEIAEYDGQIRGQMSFDDYEEKEPVQAPAQAPAPEPEAAPTGKPLDLRNRNRQQEEQLTPGEDYDPETGEIYGTNGRVVAINKAKEA